MAEKSGFFQAMWDDTLMNPTTQEYTGWWDRSYLAKEFMDYFALFVGNGVFASPTNQLMVSPGVGRTIVVSAGWAFINGSWYHNTSDLMLELAANGSSTNRIDSVRIRYSSADREVKAIVLSGETGVIQGDTLWDLELARVTTVPNFAAVSAANITDMRPDGSVCGFVTGLLEVVSAEGLFAQFQAIFEEWFEGVKGQVTGDLAIRLQQEFDELNQAVKEYRTNIEQQIERYQQNTTQQITEYKNSTNEDIEKLQQTATNAYNTMKTFVDNDFTLALQELVFIDNQCIISDERLTADSLVDVYFTADTMGAAEAATIYVDSEDGRIVLTATAQPTKILKARIRVRVM